MEIERKDEIRERKWEGKVRLKKGNGKERCKKRREMGRKGALEKGSENILFCFGVK